MAKAGTDLTKRMAKTSGDLIDTLKDGTYNTPPDPLTTMTKARLTKKAIPMPNWGTKT